MQHYLFPGKDDIILHYGNTTRHVLSLFVHNLSNKFPPKVINAGSFVNTLSSLMNCT